MMANTVTDTSRNSKSFGIVTFNLHGLDNSRSYLTDLCIINLIYSLLLYKNIGYRHPACTILINSVHPDFIGYGISSMSNKLASGVFRCRHFGGVALLWIANNIQITSCDDDGPWMYVIVT